MNKEILKSVGLVAAGVGCGYAIGFVVTKKRIEKKLEQAHNDALVAEVEQLARQFEQDLDLAKKIQKVGEYATPEDAAEALLNKPEVLTDEEAELFNEQNTEAIVSNGYAAPEDVQPVRTVSIWDIPVSELDGTAEEAETEVEANWPGNPHSEEDDEPGEFNTLDGIEIVRSPEKPYVISVEEYMTDDDEYEKVDLAYYDGDGQVTDERDTLVGDIDNLIGLENLSRFGLLSQDPTVVYVRNEKRKVDMEIHLDANSYAEVFFPKQVREERSARNRNRRDDD